MLKNNAAVERASNDPILSMIAQVNGRPAGAENVQEGVYEIGHFGFPPGYDDDYISGVADNIQQIIDHHPEVNEPDREFVITMTPIIAREQPAEGGWRWHKWGEYIGTQDPQCEYLRDEPVIEKVYVYHIYERD